MGLFTSTRRLMCVRLLTASTPPHLHTSAWTMRLHRETPESKRRIHNLLSVSGVLDQLTLLRPRAATLEECERCGTGEVVDRRSQLFVGFEA
eukprot:365544-Chlamydomonas_euryale.AAC.7